MIERYQRIQRNISGDEEVKVKYRERLMGTQFIIGVPEEYSMMSVIEKVGIFEWRQMTISERGKWLAYFELKGMQEFIQEHLRLQKQIREERTRDIQNRNRKR